MMNMFVEQPLALPGSAKYGTNSRVKLRIFRATGANSTLFVVEICFCSLSSNFHLDERGGDCCWLVTEYMGDMSDSLSKFSISVTSLIQTASDDLWRQKKPRLYPKAEPLSLWHRLASSIHGTDSRLVTIIHFCDHTCKFSVWDYE